MPCTTIYPPAVSLAVRCIMSAIHSGLQPEGLSGASTSLIFSILFPTLGSTANSSSEVEFEFETRRVQRKTREKSISNSRTVNPRSSLQYTSSRLTFHEFLESLFLCTRRVSNSDLELDLKTRICGSPQFSLKLSLSCVEISLLSI